MLETIALYGAGIVVGSVMTYVLIDIRRPDSRGVAELDLTNVAFIRAAKDVLEKDTWADVTDQANTYCERWETPLRFDADLEDGDRQ